MFNVKNRWLFAILAGCAAALILACCLAPPALISINQALVASTGTVVETYQMTWTNEPYGRCDTNVVLEFQTAPGFVISVCSKELLQALEAGGANPVPVRFSRTPEPHFLITTWHYHIEQVGGWTGSARFDGLSLRCFYSAGQNPASSACGQTRPPIREPYTIN